MKSQEVELEVRECDVPIWNKLNLTVNEASEYSNIGVSTLRKIIEKNNSLPFIIYVGRKKLIKRKEFEKWNSDTYIVK